MKKMFYIPMVFFVIFFLTGCGVTNPSTPQGCVGYLIDKPFLFGKGGYLGMQVGPTKYGMGWRNMVLNLNYTPKTYHENFEILAKDELKIRLNSHVILAIDPQRIKEVVEKYGVDGWYERSFKALHRGFVRNAVVKYTTKGVKDEQLKVQEEIKTQLSKVFEKTPFIFVDSTIGSINYPDSVAASIETKIVKEQLLQQKDLEEQIAQKDAKIRITNAEGIRKSQDIIQSTLTQNYLQHEAIEAYAKLAGSPNTTFVILPTNPNAAGMPLILNAK